jgi:hypothetical protein
MQTISRTLLISLAFIGWAAADLPKKAPLTKYSRLWTDSPFTSKPPPPEAPEEVNLLDDYALSGISPIPTGYRVTLLEKKNPENRIIVDSDKPREGFKIISVSRKAGDPLGTTVRMSSGSVTGTVSFDEAHLTPAAPPPPKAPAPGAPGAPAIPGLPNQAPQPGQTPQRQPRPRVVPPPTPQAQPGQPVPQAQAAPQTQQSDRADRRSDRRR